MGSSNDPHHAIYENILQSTIRDFIPPYGNCGVFLEITYIPRLLGLNRIPREGGSLSIDTMATFDRSPEGYSVEGAFQCRFARTSLETEDLGPFVIIVEMEPFQFDAPDISEAYVVFGEVLQETYSRCLSNVLRQIAGRNGEWCDGGN